MTQEDGDSELRKGPTQATPGQPRATDRGLRLLRIVADQHRDGVTLSEAARLADLSTSTTLRQLRSLESEGFVARTADNAYRPGPELLRIVQNLAASTSLANRAQSVLADLTMTTGESAYLAEPVNDNEAAYVAAAEGQHALRHMSWLGQRVSRHGSAVGAALAGCMDDNDVAMRLDALEAGVTAISAPIYRGTQIIAAVSVVGPTFRIDETAQRTIRSALMNATKLLSDSANTSDMGIVR